MMRWLRRLFWLGLLAAAGCAVYRALARRQAAPASAPQWSPTPSAPPRKEADAPTAATRWVLPVDGECPSGYPIKANESSKIFHVPGGRSYARTIPERCYANADDAMADGYRAAKA
jgi:hypothetical protein